ncbi:MAG: hypothetical protein OEY14_03285 [Myxococcales bacterium]|nr:hypothetical protein [Myxococcales bacterium]
MASINPNPAPGASTQSPTSAPAIAPSSPLDPEQVLAEASAELDQAREREGRARRLVRETRREVRGRELEARRQAASMELWAGICGAGASALSGLGGAMGEGSKWRAGMQCTSALSQGLGSVLTGQQRSHEIRSKGHENVAGDLSETAQEHGESMQALDRRADRLMQGLAEISEARARALLATSRG